MKKYLTNLITEKGVSLDAEITGLKDSIFGEVIGMTWNDVVDFIVENKEYHSKARNTLVAIDFKNGDIFHFLRYLAQGMVDPSQEAEQPQSKAA
ncbi:MAG: hypothetical protein ACJAS1_000540 [Oleiphilaceae bacterium]|jgi:hypothetical protein